VRVQEKGFETNPISPLPEPGEPEDGELPIPGADDAKWDVFLPDDDELDPQPAPGDFWLEPD
jgi:hypothetical protein